MNELNFFYKSETNIMPLQDDLLSAPPVLVPLPKPAKTYKQSAQSFFQKVGHACVTATEFMILGKK